ncbi:hypothetical protein ACFXO9_01370 [Nocardia tengchongensis]
MAFRKINVSTPTASREAQWSAHDCRIFAVLKMGTIRRMRGKF